MGMELDLDDVARLWKWIHDLQDRMTVTCVYCGWNAGPRESTAPALHEQLYLHVQQCEKHPMAVLRTRIAELESERGRLKAWSDTVTARCREYAEIVLGRPVQNPHAVDCLLLMEHDIKKKYSSLRQRNATLERMMEAAKKCRSAQKVHEQVELENHFNRPKPLASKSIEQENGARGEARRAADALDAALSSCAREGKET